MKFQATVEQGGRTTAGIEVPPEVVDALAAGKRPPVRATIRAYSYRTAIAPMRGRFMIPVSAEVRQRAGVAAGERVEVDVALDAPPPEVRIPPELAAALEALPQARRFFEQLSPSAKKWHVLRIAGAETEQARRRCVERSVAMLTRGRAR